MTHRVVVTGASGYIGAQLTAYARSRGCDVIVLGSRPVGFPGPVIPWRLGEPVPHAALEGAEAVIHLGHSWASDTAEGTGAGNINPRGAADFARAAIEAGVPRFVFASTTSARPQALNAYGRIKYAIEERLRALPGAAGHVVCARIGLVYGGPERGMYGTMAKLADLGVVMPMIGLDREVQPIHVDEVCEGLLRLALDPPSGRDTYILAGATPMTFGDWLRTLRLARTGKRMRLVPIPIKAALLACDATRLIPFFPTVSRERVLGLAGAAVMDSAADLAALGIAPRDPFEALAATPAGRRRLIADAATMLSYISGRRIRSFGALSRLTRALARDQASRFALPGLTRRWPALLRLFEPIRPSMSHSLSRRLHLAAMVAETMPARQPEPGLSAIVAQGMLETMALPFRLVLGRFCA
jgi:nucleoside-diphosphate-sugar epimerase